MLLVLLLVLVLVELLLVLVPLNDDNASALPEKPSIAIACTETLMLKLPISSISALVASVGINTLVQKRVDELLKNLLALSLL